MKKHDKIISKTVRKWLGARIKRSVPIILLLTALTVTMSLMSLAFASVSKTVLDIATHQAQGSLLDECVKLAILLLAQLGVSITVNFANVKANAGFSIEMRTHLFRTLMRKDYTAVSAYHSGDLLNRLSSDAEVIASGVISLIPECAMLAASIIGGFVMLYRLDKMFALLILACGPVLVAASRLYSKRFKQLHKDCQAADGRVKSFMQEIIQNILAVKSFGSGARVTQRAEELQNDSYRLKLRRTKASMAAHAAMYIAFNAGYYFTLGYGAWRLSAGAITVGTVMAMVQLVGVIQSPFKEISGMVPMIYSVIASTERLLELEALPDDDTSGAVDVKKVYDDMTGMEVRDLCFSYNEDNGIKDVSFFVKKGTVAAIAGESGAGKSTVIKLLLAILTPDSGSMSIKTESGDIPINAETRGMFAYVPQGNLILSGTIRDNLTFARENASEPELETACRAAGIWDFISAQEKGLDTVIGEHGLGLSEGQAQRISIARALVYGAPILLLDEATSALDSQTEARLLASIRSMTGRTCIIVSHKPAVLAECDTVINFE